MDLDGFKIEKLVNHGRSLSFLSSPSHSLEIYNPIPNNYMSFMFHGKQHAGRGSFDH